VAVDSSAGANKWQLVIHLTRLLRSLDRRRLLVAHRDWLPCRLAGLLTGTRVVLVAHGSAASAPRYVRRWAHMLVYRGQRFVTVGSGAQATLKKMFGLDSIVIENGVVIPPFVAPPRGEPFRLLYVGRLEAAQKRPDIAVRLTAHLAQRGVDLHTTMLGDGPLVPELRRIARDGGVQDRVAFPGWVDDPGPYLASAHALIHATRWEGNPLGVLEALAAGRPVVVSRVPGTESMAAVPGITLVEPTEATEEAVSRFADAVMNIHVQFASAQDDVYLHRIHNYARDRFSVERMVTAWQDYLEAVWA
jgi:glycosyltransferase involved in cell wall biosynthesis